MSRRVGIIVGCCLLAVGGLVAVSGVALLVAFGSAEGVRTGPHPLTSSSRALVSSAADISNAGAANSVLGETRIDVQASTQGAHGVFVGIGPAAAVDRYLTGAAIEVVTDFDVAPFGLSTQPRPGSASIGAPGSQDFWVARAETRSGTAALSWTVRDGDYRLVFMNADGNPAVNVDARFGIAVPGARTLGLTVLLVGLVLVAGGVLALVLGLRAPVPPARGSVAGGGGSRPHSPPSPAAGPGSTPSHAATSSGRTP
jgi:hypothetical protein